ncbi:MAG: CsbD family protein [Chloroflexota bacterium]
MTNQRVKGAISTTKAVVNQTVGKLTGDKLQETKGRVQQVQGKVQKGLGDAENAARKSDDRHA